MLALLAGPALAQKGKGSDDTNEANKDPYQLKLERERKEQEENERTYNATMKRLKAQAPATTSADPWRTVRPAEKSSDKR
jgi:hypothetical protein